MCVELCAECPQFCLTCSLIQSSREALGIQRSVLALCEGVCVCVWCDVYVCVSVCVYESIGGCVCVCVCVCDGVHSPHHCDDEVVDIVRLCERAKQWQPNLTHHQILQSEEREREREREHSRPATSVVHSP